MGDIGVGNIANFEDTRHIELIYFWEFSVYVSKKGTRLLDEMESQPTLLPLLHMMCV